MWIKVGLFGAAMLALGIVLSYFGVPTMLAAAIASKLQNEPATVAPPPSWTYTESTDLITDVVTFTASSPDDPDVAGATAFVQCSAASRKASVGIVLKSNLYTSESGTDHYDAYYRFDDESATKEEWFGGEKLIFVAKADEFAERMQAAHRLRLRVADKSSTHDGTISLDGAKDAIAKVLVNCQPAA